MADRPQVSLHSPWPAPHHLEGGLETEMIVKVTDLPDGLDELNVEVEVTDGPETYVNGDNEDEWSGTVLVTDRTATIVIQIAAKTSGPAKIELRSPIGQFDKLEIETVDPSVPLQYRGADEDESTGGAAVAVAAAPAMAPLRPVRPPPPSGHASVTKGIPLPAKKGGLKDRPRAAEPAAPPPGVAAVAAASPVRRAQGAAPIATVVKDEDGWRPKGASATPPASPSAYRTATPEAALEAPPAAAATPVPPLPIFDEEVLPGADTEDLGAALAFDAGEATAQDPGAGTGTAAVALSASDPDAEAGRATLTGDGQVVERPEPPATWNDSPPPPPDEPNPPGLEPGKSAAPGLPNAAVSYDPTPEPAPEAGHAIAPPALLQTPAPAERRGDGTTLVVPTSEGPTLVVADQDVEPTTPEPAPQAAPPPLPRMAPSMASGHAPTSSHVPGFDSAQTLPDGVRSPFAPTPDSAQADAATTAPATGERHAAPSSATTGGWGDLYPDAGPANPHRSDTEDNLFDDPAVHSRGGGRLFWAFIAAVLGALITVSVVILYIDQIHDALRPDQRATVVAHAKPVPDPSKAEPPPTVTEDSRPADGGTPEGRAVTETSVAEPPVPAPEPPKDSDEDGIADDADQCPKKAETVNGFEDADGCPDEVPPPPCKPWKPDSAKKLDYKGEPRWHVECNDGRLAVCGRGSVATRDSVTKQIRVNLVDCEPLPGSTSSAPAEDADIDGP